MTVMFSSIESIKKNEVYTFASGGSGPFLYFHATCEGLK